MTQQIGTQALETSGGESWQAFFAASDPTAVRSLDEWTADQLLAEALKRSAENPQSLRRMQSTMLIALVIAMASGRAWGVERHGRSKISPTNMFS